MENQQHLTVFICEDDELSREIVRKHMDAGKITYCNMLPPQTDRQALVSGIETFEQGV